MENFLFTRNDQRDTTVFALEGKYFVKLLGIESKVKVNVTQSWLTFCDSTDYTVHGILQARILEWVAFPFSRGIFPIQGSNLGLLHCRWVLYQLSHKGSPLSMVMPRSCSRRKDIQREIEKRGGGEMVKGSVGWEPLPLTWPHFHMKIMKWWM